MRNKFKKRRYTKSLKSKFYRFVFCQHFSSLGNPKERKENSFLSNEENESIKSEKTQKFREKSKISTEHFTWLHFFTRSHFKDYRNLNKFPRLSNFLSNLLCISNHFKWAFVTLLNMFFVGKLKLLKLFPNELETLFLFNLFR